ncbi:MAG: hypothetical protein EZS28_036764, partial [Streblomastix strix]
MGQSTKSNNCSRMAEPSDPEKVCTLSPNIGSQMSKEKDLDMDERREGVGLRLFGGVSDDWRVGPDCSSSESDRYTCIDDDFMNSQQCEVYYDNRENIVLILYNGKTKAVVSEAGHTDPETNRRIEADFWGFDPPEDMELWTACILAEAARMMALRLQQGILKAKPSVASAPTQDHALELSGIPREMQALKRKRDEIENVNQSVQVERPGG